MANLNKIIFCTLVITVFALNSRAQKGSILVYGTAGIRTHKEPNDDKTTKYSFNPGVGYQFSKNWTAGVMGGYGHEKFSREAADDIKSSSYRAGGFARYTYLFNQIFSLFGQSDIYYHGGKEDNINSNGFGIAVTPTVGINVSNGFALNISFGGLSYETSKIKDATESTKNFDADFGHNIGIGISKTFYKKK